MIKFIATDMDGTLLNSQHELPSELEGILEELHKRGIIFAAASGRQYYNLEKCFEGLSEHMMFIAENGTFAVYKGKEIFVDALNRELALELVRRGRDIEDGYIVLCGKTSAYVENLDPRFIAEVEKYYERYEIVENLETVDDDILKVTICDFKGAEDNSNHVFADFRDKAKITVSGYLWLDMVDPNVNKGTAIKKVQELLDITPEETMVFGDYLNDYEMMQNAYYSYAMANAHEELKKVARFVTKSNDENGVCYEIKKILDRE